MWGDPHSCSLGTDSSEFESMVFFFFFLEMGNLGESQAFACDLGDDDFPLGTPGDFDKVGAEQDTYRSVCV